MKKCEFLHMLGDPRLLSTMLPDVEFNYSYLIQVVGTTRKARANTLIVVLILISCNYLIIHISFFL